MPLIKEIHSVETHIAVWQIEESPHFFLNKMHLEAIQKPLAAITNEKKQLEYLSSRYLVQHLAGDEHLSHLTKDKSGKPVFAEKATGISISHSATHAAVLLSNNFNCGIDIETITPRVKRIASRFLSEEELSFVDADTETEQLTLFWSAKETVFKWYALGELSFSNQIQLQQKIELAEKGTLPYLLILPEKTLSIHVAYERLGGQILTYSA